MPCSRQTRSLSRHPHRQHGAVLIVMLVIMMMGIATVLISSLSTTALKTARQETTVQALAQAKEALIGYAITYGDKDSAYTHGYLPCPDVNETGITQEGIEHGNCGSTDVNTIGRLPWKSLGLPTPRDSVGECLWYAVSGTYKNNPKTSSMMNWDNTGKLSVYSTNGAEIAANEIVAVVIAPGGISPTNNPAQDRSGTAAPTCGGNYTPAAYLDNDTIHNVNNSDIATGKFILPHEHRDNNGNVTVSVNDQFIYVTRQDVWTAIQKRIAQEARKCLDDYATSSGGKYPWAAPVSTPTAFSPLIMGEYNTLFGRLPTRPSVQTESTPAIITTMQSKFDELWTALAVFSASKTSANLAAMQTKASAAKSAADTVKDFYNGTQLENPASNLKNAADDAKDDLNTSSSDTDISTVQQAIINAANDFTNEMSAVFSQAPGMANTWPASCTLFSSAYWNDWKDLVFYQLANGFKPGSAASCGNCLSVEGSGHNAAGSGSYRSTIIVAGKKLTANRITTNINDYLEADNLLPKDDSSKPYKTYRVTDAEYQTTNDLVLCLDGKVNCK